MTALLSPRGPLELHRVPHDPRSPLRAWDASDEMVLQHLADSPPPPGTSVVVIGDAWGALAIGLDHLSPTLVSDSHLARRATEANRARNGLPPATRPTVATVAEVPDPIDLVVLKLPKSGDRLADLLHALAPRLADGATVVTAAMTRHLHRSHLELLETGLGPTVTTRAVKKARLALTTRDPARDPGPSPWPTRWEGPDGLVVVHHAGVFGPGRIDPGTRLLLAHLPTPGRHRRVVDLGCGDGVIGTVLAQRDPAAEVTFIDDSHAAVASARATWAETIGDRAARFSPGDGLLDLAEGPALEPGSVDLVVSNPPFHQDHAVATDVAARLLAQAHDVLAPGGELRIVGNRHLRHDLTLRRRFGAVEVVASDPRFVVLSATRR